MKKGDRIVLEKPKKFAARLDDEFNDISFLSESSLKKLWSYKGDNVWNKYLERDRRSKMILQRDIVLLTFPFSDLKSSKIRPAIVLSNDEYNSQFEDFVAVPLTSNLHLRDTPS